MTTDNRTNEQIVLKVLHPEATRNLPMAEGYAEKAVDALRAAGRLAGEPSEAQVESACVAYESTNAFGSERATRMRAALEAAARAAQGAAPRAAGERGDPYTCVDLGHEDCDGSHRDHRAPVLPSSGVDEDALWKVVREAKNDWLRRCGQPGHTEDIDVWIARAVAEWLKGQGR